MNKFENTWDWVSLADKNGYGQESSYEGTGAFAIDTRWLLPLGLISGMPNQVGGSQARLQYLPGYFEYVWLVILAYRLRLDYDGPIHTCAYGKDRSMRIYWKSLGVGYIHRNALCPGRMSSFHHPRIWDFAGIWKGFRQSLKKISTELDKIKIEFRLNSNRIS